jgi:Abnormal spindle-like microcephaly-assoc'd, ASPM-SPD-2-Hydin
MKDFSRMDKTRLACRFLGLLLAGSGFLAIPVHAGVGVNPTSLSFGSVTVNTTSQAATVVLTNGGGPVSIQQISSSLPEFVVISPAMPINLGPHGSASIQVVFRPDAALTFSGTIVLQTNRKNSATISISGTGTTAAPTSSPSYLLSPGASSLNLGKMLVGTSTSQTLALTNTGTGGVNISSINISQATTGSGFSVSGFTGALTLAAGQSLPLTVTFAPTTSGIASGSLNVVSSATNSPAVIALTGSGVQPLISVVPSSMSFGKVTVGVTNTQTFTVSNPGTASLSIGQPSVAGTGFSLSGGVATPVSVPPGGSAAVTVGFTPTSASSFSGNLTLTANAPNSPVVVPLAGTGVSAVLQITPSPSSVSFGSITTQTSATQNVTLTNTGNSSVSVSQIAASGAGFSASGFALPVTLTAGQSTSFNVAFAPKTAGSLSGGVTVTSNAANSPLVIPLTGAGAAPVSHSVSLNWTPSSSSFGGFNVYRGTVSGGPYTRLNAGMTSATSYADTSVASGQTYYYVTTEVGSTGVESSYSNEASAIIP